MPERLQPLPIDLAPCEDTIAAISTAVGSGAIGIVRLSGPEAVALASRSFRPAGGRLVGDQESHVILYGHVVDPVSGDLVDEALLAVMRKPRTYTREDVAEFHCHGGAAAQRAVLRLMLRSGARLAEPGEFTRRAFLHGRIDLAQAEGVAAVVAARSSGALRAAVRQLEGGLSRQLGDMRRRLIAALATVEATVDFSDEDVDSVDWQGLAAGLRSVEEGLQRLLRTALLGRALERGVRIAIVGKPNVGKSSLLNVLLMRERAIVSEIAGTTRDTVEELVEIGGVPIQLVDTAGLRNGGDEVEQLGVARSVEAMEQADLVMMVVDARGPWDSADVELLAGLDARRTIVVANKADLVGAPDEAADELGRVLGGGSGPEVSGGIHVVSALTGSGVDGLRDCLRESVADGQRLTMEEPILASERHTALVEDALGYTQAALRGALAKGPEELVCEDLRQAIVSLGRITGEELTPDLLDEIFSRFCLGK